MFLRCGHAKLLVVSVSLLNIVLSFQKLLTCVFWNITHHTNGHSWSIWHLKIFDILWELILYLLFVIQSSVNINTYFFTEMLYQTFYSVLFVKRSLSHYYYFSVKLISKHSDMLLIYDTNAEPIFQSQKMISKHPYQELPKSVYLHIWISNYPA